MHLEHILPVSIIKLDGFSHVSRRDAPPYAILSHTWGGDEPSGAGSLWTNTERSRETRQDANGRPHWALFSRQLSRSVIHPHALRALGFDTHTTNGRWIGSGYSRGGPAGENQRASGQGRFRVPLFERTQFTIDHRTPGYTGRQRNDDLEWCWKDPSIMPEPDPECGGISEKQETLRVLEKEPIPDTCKLMPARTVMTSLGTLSPSWFTYIADAASILAGVIATLIILNFNYANTTCPTSENHHHWLSHFTIFLDHHHLLPESFRCPDLQSYVIAMSTYTAVGIFHLLQPPRYWPAFGLLAIFVSVFAGSWFGIQSMLDFLILGGFMSLLCSKFHEFARSGKQPRCYHKSAGDHTSQQLGGR